MAAPLTPTTELEAVNEMLEVIGEAPVSSLAVTGRTDVAIAQSVLNREIRRLCARGWYWNTEHEVTLSVDGGSKIPVPANALRVDPSDLSSEVTQRGGYLYDLKNHTYTFTSSIKVDIVYALSFDDLVEDARAYVAIVAARRFAKRMLGDETTVEYTNEDVMRALIQLEQAESDAAEHTLLHDPHIYNTVRRFRTTLGGDYI